MKKKFIKTETYCHKCAVETLASWINGVIEEPFLIDGSIAFVPDITCYTDGIIQSIYEVVHTHPLSAKKYGLIQYYCFRNVVELTVHEVSADWILSQKEKPERIRPRDSYIIDPFEYENDEDILLKT